MVLLVVLAWVVVAIGCWIGYQLIQQNGRILLHLESLERQLTELKLRSVQPFTAPPMAKGLDIGTAAPAFELPDLSGQAHRLEEWRGRKLLLIFFNPDCGFCRQMAPDIAGIPIDDKTKPMPVLVSTGRAEDNHKMAEEHGLKCPVLLQKQMEVESMYGVTGTPIGYLIDEKGNIASEMAIGAPALLEIAFAPLKALAVSTDKSAFAHGKMKLDHDLTHSRIKRDGLAAGTPAPAFRLPRLDGDDLSLEDFRGRKVLLIFSDPGCGPCQQLSSKLSEVWSPESDVQILMISRGSKEANQAKAQEHGLKFPIVLQKQWEISRLYAMFATPVGYLIDENGVIMKDVATGADAIVSLLSSASASEFQEVARTE